jgi:hypothetical protein
MRENNIRHSQRIAEAIPPPQAQRGPRGPKGRRGPRGPKKHSPPSPTSPESPRSPSSPPRAPRAGSALVIVLAFLVLLTTLIIVFLDRALTARKISASSINLTKTETLARAALTIITNDLRAELIQNSTPHPTAGINRYEPKPIPTASGTTPAINPTRSGTLNPNLIRYSGDPPPAAGFDTRATTTSSTTPAQNHRRLTPARWNLHWLNPTLTPTDPAPNPDQFTAPHWVLVTANGPEYTDHLTAAHQHGGATPVLGRYAFAIYDEGGLLDANVAGYPANLDARQLGRKGSPALLDLTLILSGQAADNLVGWRNHATARATGDLIAGYRFTDSGSAYHHWLFPYATGTVSGTTTGTVPAFLTVSATARDGRTDQYFPSRQALIKYQQAACQHDPAAFPPAALQYLATYTRALNRPNFTPRAAPLTVTATVTYPATATAPNPAVHQLLRDTGAPAVKQRFPLARLSLFPPPTAPAPTKEQAALIYQYFGLTHSAGPVWEYSGGGRNAKTILNLSEVPADRDPDFFELLRAAILEGSLFNNDGEWRKEKATGGHPLMDYPSQFILQIGANIIQQAQPHNLPLLIRAGAGATAVTVSGGADLPYFSELLFWPYRPTENALFTSRGGGVAPDKPAVVAGLPDFREILHGFIVFELWNPHRPPSAALAPNLTPQKIRLVLRNQSAAGNAPRFVCAKYKWNGTGYDAYEAPKLEINLQNFAAFMPLTLNHTVSDFREPALVAPEHLAADAAGDAAQFVTVSDSGKTRVALWLGRIAEDTPDREYIKQFVNTHGLTDSDLPDHAYSWADFTEQSDIKSSVALQYLHPNGEWYYYQGSGTGAAATREDDITRVAAGVQQSGVASEGNLLPTKPIAASPWALAPERAQWTDFDYFIGISIQRADPRNTMSTRGSFSAQITPGRSIRPDANNAGAPARFNYTVGPQNFAVPFSKDGGDSVPAGEHRPYPGLSWENTADGDPATRTYLVDADGVLRPADGGKGAPSVYLSGSARPALLRRPLRSVAEMGFAARGIGAWKTLNFFTPESADAGLLDYFSVDEEPLTAGKINLNTRQPLTLAAALKGAYRDDETGAYLTADEARMLADKIVARTERQPLESRADLVRNLLADADFTAALDTVSGGGVKSRREAFVRALADVGTTRTWNLLIDLVAQSGQYTRGANRLEDFTVEGEKHYWLHVAIDRYTGEIIGEQLEEVHE